MAEYKVVDATQLDADLTAIADAIRERAGTHVKIEFPEGFLSAIRNIPGGEIEVENLSQVHYWTKTGMVGGTINETYNSNGLMLGGVGDTIQYADEVALEGNSLVLVNPSDYTLTSDDDAAEEVLVGKYVCGLIGLTDIYRIPSDAVIIYYSASQYVPAHLNANIIYKLSVTAGTEEQTTIIVSDDITAYPENGEQDGFTYVYQGVVGMELPELTNPGTASDVASGKQLIDQYGNVVDGTLKDGGDLTLTGGKPAMYFDTDGGSGVIANAETETDMILRAGDKVEVVTAYDEFGDATAADVAAGKTFTSAEGLKVVGTASGGFTVTDDGAGNVTITSDAITDNDGDVVIA